MLCRALAVEPRTHRDDYLVQVAYDVVLDLVGLQHDDPAPLRCLKVLKAKASKTIAMLDHDGAHLWRAQQAQKLLAPSVQTGTDLLDGGDDGRFLLHRLLGQTGQLPIEVIFLDGA